MATLKESPSQTAGPFVHIGCVPQSAGLAQRHMGSQLGTSMITEELQESSISIDIMVFDGAGDLVKDALIEIWQAGPEGEYANTHGFTNWGRNTSTTVASYSGMDRCTWYQPGVDHAHLLS